MPKNKDGKKVIATNKKAYHDYYVLSTYEAGIQLFGTEVKSIRAGTVNLKDSFCHIKGGEMFALGVHISPYGKGNIFKESTTACSAAWRNTCKSIFSSFYK